jgi:hypothetical protein
MTFASLFASPLARLGAFAASAATLVACVTDSNRCVPGYVYAPQYDGCLAIGDDAGDAAAPDGAGPTDGGGGGGGDGGLGDSCHADSDCTGQASYCLKDPTAAPTDPGICSIPGCTAAECGSAYSCCDCTGAVLSSLAAWPKNVCAPIADKSQLTPLGCNCL